MSIESDYYENADFWDDALFANQRPRFEAVADLIPADTGKLIDIGCGNGAFVHYLSDSGRDFAELHATDRSSVALERVRVPKTQSSIDALPFADRAFDAATCLEVIEHLPHGIYEKGLAEICRVAARYVIIGVPFEEDIEADLVRCPSCTSQFNPDYHMRSYSEQTMTHLLEEHGFFPARKTMCGGMAHYRVLSDLMERRRRRAKPEGNPFPTAIPCPMCGFMLPPSPGASFVPPAAPSAPVREHRGLGALVRKALRTGTDYGWIVMQYERRG